MNLIIVKPKNSSIPLSYISYSFEPYSESPSYSNFTGALFANQVDFGRTVLFASLENMNEEEDDIEEALDNDELDVDDVDDDLEDFQIVDEDEEIDL